MSSLCSNWFFLIGGDLSRTKAYLRVMGRKSCDADMWYLGFVKILGSTDLLKFKHLTCCRMWQYKAPNEKLVRVRSYWAIALAGIAKNGILRLTSNRHGWLWDGASHENATVFTCSYQFGGFVLCFNTACSWYRRGCMTKKMLPKVNFTLLTVRTKWFDRVK